MNDFAQLPPFPFALLATIAIMGIIIICAGFISVTRSTSDEYVLQAVVVMVGVLVLCAAITGAGFWIILQNSEVFYKNQQIVAAQLTSKYGITVVDGVRDLPGIENTSRDEVAVVGPAGESLCTVSVYQTPASVLLSCNGSEYPHRTPK